MRTITLGMLAILWCSFCFSKMIDEMKLDSVYVCGHSDGGKAAKGEV
ncbi:hypothetical protein [Parapedobacter indicus]|uniref:Uncharacterized protein n=1 Tax=Parapedobacter indicus TaxID=1477437 RepID=A0A1I3LV03_9SPHI|nr:hypothetical protein [Parapedobacter indicus]PPL01375.1 hypothetical protein CLV26_106184 [Parapedobacter indicus]SFI88503.1 hypothetical protein SAMN05444682_106151 [Parapedobacter indicus]